MSAEVVTELPAFPCRSPKQRRESLGRTLYIAAGENEPQYRFRGLISLCHHLPVTT